MKIRKHRLVGDRIHHAESPNQGGPFGPGAPDTIVLHYTATASAEAAVQVLSDPAREVSAHVVVGRDGQIVQLVAFDTVAWHAGRSVWAGREGLNRYSLGIEVDNAGQLDERDGRFLSWLGREYPPAEVMRAVHRNQTAPSHWHRFTEPQLREVEELCAGLIEAYSIRQILGHEEIAPDRKVDPGPAFPLDGLRARLLPTGPAPASTGEARRREEG